MTKNKFKKTKNKFKKTKNKFKKTKNIKELETITEGLRVGEKYGLTSEILWSAFHYLLDPTINKSSKDVVDAVTYGINDWVK